MSFADGFWLWLGVLTAEAVVAGAVLIVVGIIVLILYIKDQT